MSVRNYTENGCNRETLPTTPCPYTNQDNTYVVLPTAFKK